MKNEKLKVFLIAAVVVVALVGGLMSLKIEPAQATPTPTPSAAVEMVSPTPGPEISPVPDDKLPTPTPEQLSGTPLQSEAPVETPVASTVPSPVPTPVATPAPSETPAPTVEPSQEPETETCTIEIRCDVLLDTSLVENEAILPYIPADGTVLAETEVELEEGDTAFDVLNRVTRANDIHMETRKGGSHPGDYIEGIAYLYEFDAGPLSGWVFQVNGTVHNYGASSFELQPGDELIWMYTCDLGRDMGSNLEW